MRDETSPPIISPLRSAAALAIAGVRPLKSKGQNFLVQARIADRIVAAAELAPGDDVIEIGPGLGILSERIARCPIRRLALVELDPRLSERLCAHFEHDSYVSIIARDFLKTDFRELYERQPLRIIGNLPFNVAAAILERLCGHHAAIARMVLMFQREVAERIRAARASFSPRRGTRGAVDDTRVLFRSAQDDSQRTMWWTSPDARSRRIRAPLRANRSVGARRDAFRDRLRPPRSLARTARARGPRPRCLSCPKSNRSAGSSHARPRDAQSSPPRSTNHASAGSSRQISPTRSRIAPSNASAGAPNT